VILARELASAYGSFATGVEPDLPPLPIQYSDFAHWQNHRLQDETLEGPLSYWRKQLGGVLPVLELPTDRPRPARRTFSGGRVSVVLPPRLADSLTSLGRQEHTTLFATLLAAFNTLLHRESGQEDIIVGSPVAGRIRVETEPLIGVFINTLALRTDLSGSPTFRELLGRVRSVVNGALSHQELSFDRLVADLRPPRFLDRAPIFSVFLQLRNLPRAQSAASGLTFVETPVDSGFAASDISLDMQDGPGGLDCHADYSTALFDAETIGRLLNDYQRILEAAVSNPDQPIAVMS
jgi:non-ribosomal peptide synthetase component F